MNSLENKNAYKYRIGFSQSLSTGIIAFEGYVNFDHQERDENGSVLDYQAQLVIMLRGAEQVFKEAGYRIASNIVPKEVMSK